MGDVLSPQSFGALLLRLGAMIRPTSHEVGYSSRCTVTDAVRFFFLRVTICRDARSSVRPRQSETSSRSFDNGRTDRASLL